VLHIIIISGPTASGKTKKAVKFCLENNGEIISCDSRQIYKYLDIGTNKEGELSKKGIRTIQGIPQYLTDIKNPNETYDVAQFIYDADLKISEISKKGKIPVIVGGTGFYIKSLIYGIDNMPKANNYLRQKLNLQSNDELYKSLLNLDSKSAVKNKNNRQRLLRALEVNLLSGKPMSFFFKTKVKRYIFKHYNISIDKQILYERINYRCKNMIENGMIEETKRILNMGFDKKIPALSSVGYQYIIQYLEHKISKKSLIKQITEDTKKYAKRQMTWFKSQPDIENIKV
jgi:tRNA dimethylallyltransferase